MLHSIKRFWKISRYFRFNPFLVIAWYSRLNSRLAKKTQINDLKFFVGSLEESLIIIKNKFDNDRKALNSLHMEIFRAAYSARNRDYSDSKLDDLMLKLGTFTLIHTTFRDPTVNQQTAVVVTDDVLYDNIIKFTKRYPNALGVFHVYRHDFEGMKPAMFLVREVQSYVPMFEVLSVCIFDINQPTV